MSPSILSGLLAQTFVIQPSDIAHDSLLSKDSFFGAAALLIVAAAFKYFLDIQSAKRKARLSRIDDQLRTYYGPLFAMSIAQSRAWDRFCAAYFPNGIYLSDPSRNTEEQYRIWRLWMSEIFMPINLAMVDIITQHSDLLEGESMPASFQAFLAHVYAYKATIKRWSDSDYSVHTSLLDYPDAIEDDIRNTYKALKTAQQRLLGLNDNERDVPQPKNKTQASMSIGS